MNTLKMYLKKKHNKSVELINYPTGNLLAHFKRYESNRKHLAYDEKSLKRVETLKKSLKS